jgi:hypothetical protein
MISFFVRPWEISATGKEIRSVEIQGQQKTLQEIRQRVYENIVDETMFIARASEGAVSAEWLMGQPIFIRKKYVESFSKELKDREARLNARKKS